DKQVIKEEVVSHFESRFKTDSRDGLSVANMPLKRISVEDAANIERPIMEDEVLSAI
ncbi:hypothetical protein MKW92_024741, partial [Papaver armeniacum]